jgi:hypothetical protein
MLALTSRPIALAAALLAAAATAAPAAAADPPPDLPPLPGGAATPAPASGTPPAAPSGRGAPAEAPGALPQFYPLPGVTPPAPGSVPPGYAVPYYFAPYTMPQVARPSPLDLPPLPPRRRHNPGMMAGGILMVVGGVASIFAGAVLVAQSTDRIDIYCDSPGVTCAHLDDLTRRAGGVIMMTAGALVGAAGIPLWLIGGRMELVPKDQKAAGPELRVGPGSASLVVRF